VLIINTVIKLLSIQSTAKNIIHGQGIRCKSRPSTVNCSIYWKFYDTWQVCCFILHYI